MARPVTIILGLFTLCICLAVNEARSRSSRNIFRRDDVVVREDDSGAIFVRDDRSSSDENDEKDVKRDDDAPAVNAEDAEEREARSKDSDSSEENDDGGVDRDTRAVVKKSKKSKSKTTTPAPENLCPLGTKYKSECNRCFCNPVNGVSGCTMMACFKLVIPSTAAPTISAEEAAEPQKAESS